MEENLKDKGSWTEDEISCSSNTLWKAARPNGFASLGFYDLTLMICLCTYQCYPGGRGRGGGAFDILSKIFVKNRSPGTMYFVKKTQKSPPKYDVYNKNNQLLFTPHILIDELMLKIEADVWNYALILSDYIPLLPEQHQQSPPSWNKTTRTLSSWNICYGQNFPNPGKGKGKIKYPHPGASP